MNARRRSMVLQAFRVLDRDGSGVVDLDDVREVYNCSSHPDVLSGRRTKDQVLSDFLLHFTLRAPKEDGSQPQQVQIQPQEVRITPKDFEVLFCHSVHSVCVSEASLA